MELWLVYTNAKATLDDCALERVQSPTVAFAWRVPIVDVLLFFQTKSTQF